MLANQSEGGGMDQEALNRLQSIIRSLQNEKDSFAKRLARANRDRINKPEKLTMEDDDGSYKENYLYLKDTGLVWSSSVLAPRLRQPASNKPIPFSKVYVCDFELDFISKDDIDVLIKPMSQLKQRNHYLTSEMEDLTSSLDIVQQQEQEARE